MTDPVRTHVDDSSSSAASFPPQPPATLMDSVCGSFTGGRDQHCSTSVPQLLPTGLYHWAEATFCAAADWHCQQLMMRRTMVKHCYSLLFHWLGSKFLRYCNILSKRKLKWSVMVLLLLLWFHPWLTPLRNQWDNIMSPIVEDLKLQNRFNPESFRIATFLSTCWLQMFWIWLSFIFLLRIVAVCKLFDFLGLIDLCLQFGFILSSISFIWLLVNGSVDFCYKLITGPATLESFNSYIQLFSQLFYSLKPTTNLTLISTVEYKINMSPRAEISIRDASACWVIPPRIGLVPRRN